MKFSQDYGDPLLNVVCFDPNRRELQIGTNQYFTSNYCSAAFSYFDLEVKKYIFTTNQSPWFNMTMDHRSIEFKFDSNALTDYRAIFFYQETPAMRLEIKSADVNAAYFEAAVDQTTIGAAYQGYNIDIAALDGQASLRIETPSLDKVINLNLQDLMVTSATEVKLREFAICDQGVSKKILLFASDFYV